MVLHEEKQMSTGKVSFFFKKIDHQAVSTDSVFILTLILHPGNASLICHG